MVDANALLAPMAPGGLRSTLESAVESVAAAMKGGDNVTIRAQTEGLVRLTLQVDKAQKAKDRGGGNGGTGLDHRQPAGATTRCRVAAPEAGGAGPRQWRLPKRRATAQPGQRCRRHRAGPQALGFEVREAANLGKTAMEETLAEFSDEAAGADFAIVFYAGHGLEVGGENYLIPVDARLATDRRLRFEAIPLDDVMAALEGVKGIRMVLLDACRNNPFSAAMKLTAASRSVGRGLSRVEAETGTVISFAAREGTIALGRQRPQQPVHGRTARTPPGARARDPVSPAQGARQRAGGDQQRPGAVHLGLAAGRGHLPRAAGRCGSRYSER